ncbi:hypothetical protein C7E24_21510, partial [Stenotrophomonas maltophilia]
FEIEGVNRAIVVSNASTSDLNVIENEWGSKLRVVRLSSNSGSANGYSVGIEAALADNAEFIWLMDDDNAPRQGALGRLHSQLEITARAYGAERSAALGFRPSHQADIAQGVNPEHAYPLRSSFFGFHYRQLFFKIKRRIGPKAPLGAAPSSVQIPYAPYGGLMASRKLFEAIGLPNADFVLYADDTEYTRRITSRGGAICLATDAELEDLEESWNLKESYPNTFLGWLKGGSDFRAFYAARNQTYFDKKNLDELTDRVQIEPVHLPRTVDVLCDQDTELPAISPATQGNPRWQELSTWNFQELPALNRPKPMQL